MHTSVSSCNTQHASLSNRHPDFSGVDIRVAVDIKHLTSRLPYQPAKLAERWRSPSNWI